MFRTLLITCLFLPGLLSAQQSALPPALLLADSISHHHPDSAFSLTEKILQSNPDPYFQGRAYFRQGRILINEKQAYHQAEAAFLQAVELLDDTYQGRAYRNLGRVCDRLGRYDEALQHFRRALDIFQREKDTEGLADTYNSMGNVLKDIGEYHEAILHFYQGMALFQELGIVPGQARVNNNLGNCYVELDSVKKGLTFYRKAMQMLEDRPAMQAIVRMNVARHAAPAESIPEYYKLIAYHQSRKRVDQEAVVTVNLGHAYWADGQSAKAKAAYERTVELAASIDDMRLIISANDQLANIAGQEGDYEASIRYAQRAFEMSIPNFPKDSPGFNPPVSLINLKLESLHILQDKALSYLWRYRNQSHDLADLRTAIATFECAIEVLHALYTASQNTQAKFSFKDQFHLLFDLTLSAYWDLWEETKDTNVIEDAFRVMEFSKASYLAERMLNDRLKAKAKLPDVWLKKERDLQHQLIEVEKEILITKRKKGHQTFEKLQAKRFQVIQEARQHQEKLKSSHPDYYRMEQFASPKSLDSLQKQLLQSPDEAILSYFVGENWMHSIQIRQDTVLFLRKALLQDFNEKINRFRTSLYGYWTLRSGCESGTLEQGLCDSLPQIQRNFSQQYAEEAYDLYQFLFEEWKDKLPRRLTLIPEGVLSFLPFEVLLTTPTDPAKMDWQHMPYFIQKHVVSYAYSASVLQQQIQKKKISKPEKLLAIAPFAGKSPNKASQPTQQASMDQTINHLRSGHWGKLPYSQKEVEMIHDIWGGKVLLDEEAGKARFLQAAPAYSILHLATHAKAHDYEPLLSLLAFADTFAPLPELAGEHLPAELVVLSACESGLGQLQDGEGVISLARAFTQAGARALVTTLWSVEDRATARIMADFYRYLREGLTKDAALRQARLDYLAMAESAFAHPFFWAGLTASGNMQVLHKSKNNKTPRWVLGIGLISIAIFLFLFVKNRVNT